MVCGTFPLWRNHLAGYVYYDDEKDHAKQDHCKKCNDEADEADEAAALGVEADVKGGWARKLIGIAVCVRVQNECTL